MNRLSHWFLLWLGLFLLLIGAIWLSTPPADVAGTVHPTYEAMKHSGESVATAEAPKWLAYAFGLGIIGIFAFCLFMGARKADPIKNAKIRNGFLLGFGVYVTVYSLTTFTYWDYAMEGGTSFVMGFPVPTAWMMYGIFFAPLLFSLIYILKFHQWVLSPEEEAVFHEIVRERRNREANQN